MPTAAELHRYDIESSTSAQSKRSRTVCAQSAVGTAIQRGDRLGRFVAKHFEIARVRFDLVAGRTTTLRNTIECRCDDTRLKRWFLAYRQRNFEQPMIHLHSMQANVVKQTNKQETQTNKQTNESRCSSVGKKKVRRIVIDRAQQIVEARFQCVRCQQLRDEEEAIRWQYQRAAVSRDHVAARLVVVRKIVVCCVYVRGFG